MVLWLLTLACCSLALEAGKGGGYKYFPTLTAVKRAHSVREFIDEVVCRIFNIPVSPGKPISPLLPGSPGGPREPGGPGRPSEPREPLRPLIPGGPARPLSPL